MVSFIECLPFVCTIHSPCSNLSSSLYLCASLQSLLLLWKRLAQRSVITQCIRVKVTMCYVWQQRVNTFVWEGTGCQAIHADQGLQLGTYHPLDLPCLLSPTPFHHPSRRIHLSMFLSFPSLSTPLSTFDTYDTCPFPPKLLILPSPPSPPQLPLHLLVRDDLVELWEGTLSQQLEERAALIQSASGQLERVEQDRVAKVERHKHVH